MHITLISIFPELFQQFVASSLIGKSVEAGRLSFDLVNPRDFCTDKQKKVDDEIYGGGVGLLMKAEPVISSIRNTVSRYSEGNVARRNEIEESLQKDPSTELPPRGLATQRKGPRNINHKTKIILVGPSKSIFNQKIAHDLSVYDHLIFICGRYEGIDHRVKLWCEKEFGDDFCEISLGKFVTLGGELPAMTMIEAITRLIPGVIKEEQSRQDESYRPEQGMNNIEYPQYTRPEIVEGMRVPELLLSGHHAHIQQWKDDMIQHM